MYRLHIETVLSLFFYNKTLLYLLIALWLFLEFLHIKEIVIVLSVLLWSTASVVLLYFFSWSLCCLFFFDLRPLLSFCVFSLGHCVVCSSLIYGFCCPFVLFLLVIVLSVLLWFRASVVLLSFFSLGDCVVCPLIYGFCCPVVLFLFVIALSVLWSTVSVVLLSFFSWWLCCLSFFDLRFLLSCCPFSLGDCVVCPSLIYGFCCPVVLFLFVIVLSVLLWSTVSVVLLSFFSWWLCCLSFFDLRFLLSCCPFSLRDCVVCPSSIYGFCCPVVLFLLVIVLSVVSDYPFGIFFNISQQKKYLNFLRNWMFLCQPIIKK